MGFKSLKATKPLWGDNLLFTIQFLGVPLSHPMVLNPGLLDWKSSTLASRALLLFYYIVLKRAGIGNLLSRNSACTATAVHVPLHWPQMLNAFWLFPFLFFVPLLIIDPNSSNHFLKILKDTINYNCYFKKNNKNKCSKSFEKDWNQSEQKPRRQAQHWANILSWNLFKLPPLKLRCLVRQQ